MTQVIFANSSIQNEISYFSINHPAKNVKVLFGYDKAGNLFELQSCHLNPYVTWFINERVSNNQKCLFVNEIDPRFFFLAYLLKNGQRFSPLDQIVTSNDESNLLPLRQSLKKWKLSVMCDVNDKLEDMVLCRYNEEKTLSWLEGKVRRTAASLRKWYQSRSSFSSSSKTSLFASTFIINQNTPTDVPLTDYTTEAVQIVCDYLDEDTARKLADRFRLDDKTLYAMAVCQSTKRKADWEVAVEVEKDQFDSKATTQQSSNKAKSSSTNTIVKVIINFSYLVMFLIKFIELEIE
jgi:hypothetical protein